jgi:hypothetical protein
MIIIPKLSSGGRFCMPDFGSSCTISYPQNQPVFYCDTVDDTACHCEGGVGRVGGGVVLNSFPPYRDQTARSNLAFDQEACFVGKAFLAMTDLCDCPNISGRAPSKWHSRGKSPFSAVMGYSRFRRQNYLCEYYLPHRRGWRSYNKESHHRG